MTAVAERVLAHYRRHARDLPWRHTRDPYAIWVCEIMAQQTRLETMRGYWERWMARFPTVRALAEAPLDDVLALWAGLGYYRRARNLHAAALRIVAEHGGEFPRALADIEALPGIGPYTAGAIASIALGLPAAVVDGNVARILARVFGIEAERDIWKRARELVPFDAPGDYNQGLMDLGALVCTPRDPRCLVCPLADLCVARREGRVDELPLRAARRATPTVQVELALVARGGAWLVMRRAPQGLYGGLWELPEAAALGLRVDGAPLVVHEQKLTHKTIVYRVHAARLAGAPRTAPPYDAARFASPRELTALAVSSATASLARALVERQPSWPTPKQQPSSSAKVSTRSSRGSANSATTSTGTRTSGTRRRAPPRRSAR